MVYDFVLCIAPLAGLFGGMWTPALLSIAAAVRSEESEESGRGTVAFSRTRHVGFDESTVKVMQWNILADGLSLDGFRSPHNVGWEEFYIGTRQAVERRNWLKARFNLNAEWLGTNLDYNLRCLANPDKTHPAGQKGQSPDNLIKMYKGDPGRLEEIKAALACENKCLKKVRAEETQKGKDKIIGKKLTCFVEQMLKSSSTDPTLVQLREDIQKEKKFEKEVVAWETRFKKMMSIIETTQPDVIVLEELDHYTEFAKQLDSKYTSVCSENAPTNLYQSEGMLKKRLESQQNNEPYQQQIKALKDMGIAFAPNLKSNARKFYLQRHSNANEMEVDDQGTGIFWRKTLKCKDVQMQIHTDGDAASVSVLLETSKGKDFTVVGTHLSSGPEKETRRCEELFGNPNKPGILNLINNGGKPCIFAGDLNSDRFFSEWDKVKPGVGTCSNLKSSFDRVQGYDGMQSVWKPNLPVPATVFKMRGVGTDQPTKMGELQLGTIDHIFYRGVELSGGPYVFVQDPPDPDLAGVKWSDCFNREEGTADIIKNGLESDTLEVDKRKCFKYMLPSLDFPSDHWPVLASFSFIQ